VVLGKTSITAAIACALKEMGINLMAADCDVDAPNLEILFKAKDTIINSFTVQTTMKARFVESKCIHHRKCIDENYCNFGALSWDEEKNIPIIDSIACEGCNACQWLCSYNAFVVEPVDSGKISNLKSEYGFDVISGETVLGAQTSGKLVSELKQYANDIAEEKNIPFIIIDGPPGIGCPVIATVTDLNYVIVVIEPTSASLHDAKRVISLINNFKIPFGIIINKADIWKDGYDLVVNYIKNNGIDYLGEIKFDPQWPISIANGLPIIKFEPDGPASTELKKIAIKIKEIYEKTISE
jgi:MinD superfamily P-loop ATPase